MPLVTRTMAEQLARSGIDLGDERAVLEYLRSRMFVEREIEDRLDDAIERARILRQNAPQLMERA